MAAEVENKAVLTSAVLSYVPPDAPLKEFTPPRDRAFFADPAKKSLFAEASAVDEITPYIGTELKGIQLSKLTDAQKDELALLVVERGVVFFRDQDITLEQQYDLARYYGVMDRDPIQQDPNHVTIVGREGNIRAHDFFGADFHGDHSFEIQPPSYTVLRMVTTPPTGGDTIYTSQVGLFDKLSPTFQKAFEGKTAIHSSEYSYMAAVNGKMSPHRLPIATAHPLVRTHPVSRLKSLNYNPTFVTRIEGLNGQEAFYMQAFLRDHVHSADDLTVRWRWQPGSIAFWDNRIVAHRAVPGGYDTTLREGKRVCIFGERPFYDPENSETYTQMRDRVEGSTNWDKAMDKNGKTDVEIMKKFENGTSAPAKENVIANTSGTEEIKEVNGNGPPMETNGNGVAQEANESKLEQVAHKVKEVTLSA